MSGGDFRSQKQIAQGGSTKSFADTPFQDQIVVLAQRVQFLHEDLSDFKHQMDVEILQLHEMLSESVEVSTKGKKKDKKKKGKKNKKGAKDPKSPEIHTVKGKGYPHLLAGK